MYLYSMYIYNYVVDRISSLHLVQLHVKFVYVPINFIARFTCCFPNGALVEEKLDGWNVSLSMLASCEGEGTMTGSGWDFLTISLTLAFILSAGVYQTKHGLQSNTTLEIFTFSPYYHILLSTRSIDHNYGLHLSSGLELSLEVSDDFELSVLALNKCKF